MGKSPIDGSKITKTDVLQILMKGRAFLALIIVFSVFAYMAPGFLSLGNIIIIPKGSFVVT